MDATLHALILCCVFKQWVSHTLLRQSPVILDNPMITLPSRTLPPAAQEAPIIRKCLSVSIYHTLFTVTTASTTRQILCLLSGSLSLQPSPFQQGPISLRSTRRCHVVTRESKNTAHYCTTICVCVCVRARTRGGERQSWPFISVSPLRIVARRQFHSEECLSFKDHYPHKKEEGKVASSKFIIMLVLM